MSTTIIAATTDNRQSWDAKVAEASLPVYAGTARHDFMIDALPALPIAKMDADKLGELHNELFGPHLTVWDGRKPEWAVGSESDISSTSSAAGNPFAIWSSPNLVGRDGIDAFVIREDEYDIESATYIDGAPFLNVYIDRNEGIRITTVEAAEVAGGAMRTAAREFRNIVDPQPAGIEPDDLYDDDFIKFEGLTREQVEERNNEVLASPYPRAFAMRLDGGCQDTPANLYHQIDIHNTDEMTVEIVKEAGKAWRIDARMSKESSSVNVLSEFSDWLREAVKRASALNLAEGFTADEHLA
ncbi:hypothetical protein SAMN06295974_0330 [Plantibacter flavus]|uniref:Uncharacterized protein n=1 Tax=Plantibacter flavus TaxID=150123 RepID=A0A3N2C0S5_9MICO|nr:hypothetical protein [Plantibacter flavus]ROR81106.1 hypothetical protein EDD42_1157 [Plantibacter flavus]SMG07941.1 hypothetical protein SAMN06295974_0330 [Plantibacter flavus]